MNSTLVLLARLRARAAWRKLLRTLSRPKGALLVVFTLAFFGLVLLPNVLINRAQRPPIDNVWFLNPAVLFGFWVVITASGRNTVATAFSLAEVEFLFPGPFTRRQLLLYKLTVSSLGPLGTALIFPIFLWQFALWWPALVLGIWLAFVFIQTTSLLFTLIVDWLGERFANWRRFAVAAVAAMLVFSLWQTGALENNQTPMDRLAALQSSWAAQAVLAPFAAFSHLARATTFDQLALWGGASLAANVVVVVLILRMDANFLQASLVASQRRYDWLQRAKRSGGLPSLGPRTRPRLGLPQFPRLFGAGPIAWRQSLDLMRNSARLILVLPAVLVMGAPALLMGQEANHAAVIGMTAILGWLISTMMPLGLRTDLQHVEVFKTLPLHASAIVWGSIAAAVVYPSVIQIAAVGVLSALTRHWSWASTFAVCFAVPLNLLLVSSDSILVLLYPSTRQFVPGDFLTGMRLMLSYLAKVLFVGVAAAVAGLYVLVVYLLVGESPLPMALGGWVVLMLEGAVTVWCASLLFERLDPSLDAADEQ
jgi:putative ABC exporter